MTGVREGPKRRRADSLAAIGPSEDITTANCDGGVFTTLPRRLQGRRIDSLALSAARDAIEQFDLLVTDEGGIYSAHGRQLVKVCPSVLREFARSRLGTRRRVFRDLKIAILLLASSAPPQQIDQVVDQKRGDEARDEGSRDGH